MKTLSELRALDETQLNDEILTLRKTQFNHRLKKATGSLDKPHVVREIRRNIARIKTILTEKAG